MIQLFLFVTHLIVATCALDPDSFDWILLETYWNMSAWNDENVPNGAYEILLQNICL